MEPHAHLDVFSRTGNLPQEGGADKAHQLQQESALCLLGALSGRGVQVLGVPSSPGCPGVWGHWGVRASGSFTHTKDQRGNEEANPNHRIAVRELFSLVCFSLEEKKRLFLRV